MATRLERLEQILAAKIDPLPGRHVIVDIGDELSMEAEGELPICEIIFAPPERPEVEPLLLMAASPSIDHASRETTRIEPYNVRLSYHRLDSHDPNKRPRRLRRFPAGSGS